MKLRDFVLNSNKYALRSNLFVWNRFDTSLGYYEEQNGELWFKDGEGNQNWLGEHIETWFVMDDESVVFDDSPFPNTFKIWHKKKSRWGAITRFGTLLYVENGWVVKLNFDGTVEQLFKVSDESISIRIEDHKAYVSRPINNFEDTYDEVYDCYGKLDKEETEESFQYAKTYAQYNSNKEAISELVNEETKFIYSKLGETLYSLSLWPPPSDLEIVVETLFRNIDARFIRRVHNIPHQLSSFILVDSLLKKWLTIDRKIDSKAFDNPSILSANDDFDPILSAYRESSDTVIRIFALIAKDCDCWDNVKSIFLNEEINHAVITLYDMIDFAKRNFTSCEKYCS